MAAGWHHDYEDPTQERYWDGQRWTDRRRPAKLPNRYSGPQGENLLAADVYALSLLKHLQDGGRPSTVAATFRTEQGEEVFCSVDGALAVLAEGQYIPPSHSTLGIGTSVLMLGATLGASALMNGRRESRARAAAALRWRSLSAGVIHLTSHRVAAQGHGGWNDIWLAHVNQVVLDADGVVLFVSGAQPLKVCLGGPLSGFILLHWLVLGTVPSLHPEVAAEIHAANMLINGRAISDRSRGLPS